MPDNANQQTFRIHKLDVKPPFLQVNIDVGKEAHRQLKTGGAFSLGLWYSSNADTYYDNIYSVTIQRDLGIGKQTYYNARDKLVNYGYLIPDKVRKYEYHFYERSPVREEGRNMIKSKPGDERGLQAAFVDLMERNIGIEDMSLEEWGLYNRGKKNGWPESGNF